MVETDPFEAFNRRQGMGKVRDPYPRLADMRRRGPIQRMSIQDMLGPQMTVSNLIKMDVYAALSHDAVAEVLRDGVRFSSKGYSMSMGPVMGRTILEMDEPEHGRYRRLLQHAFSRKALDRWQHELVTPIVNGLIDRFADRGSAELIRELTFPFPVSVIAGMIGVPQEDLADFHRWAIELISVGFNPTGGVDASRNLGALFQRVLDGRRKAPRDDLMSVLAFASVDGTHLTDEEIISFCRLLAPAGAETTYRSSSNLLFGLLSRPDQLEAVRRDPALIPQAIEEGLRWEAPLTNILRIATRDTEVCGVPIPAGAFISVNLGAANRDETRYERADEFDIFRAAKTHMAFAFGAHRCLGMHLATMETSVVLRSLFDRLPGLRLDPDAEDVHITGMIFRTPLELPVRFDPA